jgi:hypothetical protein
MGDLAPSHDGEIRWRRIHGDEDGGDGGTSGSVRCSTSVQIHGNGGTNGSRYPHSLPHGGGGGGDRRGGGGGNWRMWMWWSHGGMWMMWM